MTESKYEENKFIVFKTSDTEKISREGKHRLAQVIGEIRSIRLSEKRQLDPEYYVCNQDEPYGPDVLNEILKGEDRKKAPEFRTLRIPGEEELKPGELILPSRKPAESVVTTAHKGEVRLGYVPDPDGGNSAPSKQSELLKANDLLPREQLLEMARKTIINDREDNYGAPEDSFSTVAAMWMAYLNYGITAVDVAAMMALLKIARLANTPFHDDSWTDLAGYAACGYEVAKKGLEK